MSTIDDDFGRLVVRELRDRFIGRGRPPTDEDWAEAIQDLYDEFFPVESDEDRDKRGREYDLGYAEGYDDGFDDCFNDRPRLTFSGASS